jgi:hypothetical protein
MRTHSIRTFAARFPNVARSPRQRFKRLVLAFKVRAKLRRRAVYFVDRFVKV